MGLFRMFTAASTLSGLASAYSLFGNGLVCAPGFNDERITLFRQQVRALNLAYLLHEKAHGDNLNVAVVGAGGCGVTLTGALLLLGHRVTLFDRQDVKMYLQRGCETRYLHPNSYDWPTQGSDIPFADIPLLSWRAATATSVSRQICEKFDAIAQIETLKKNYTERRRCLVKLNVPKMEIEWQSLVGEELDDRKSLRHAGTDCFDHIMLCVGFGIEDEVDDERYFSYWRNDSFNQVRTTSYAASRAEYWVSGTGDGALIDVQRLTIGDFDQSRFVHDVWTSRSVSVVSESELREFQQSVLTVAERRGGPTALYDAIEDNRYHLAVKTLDNHIHRNRRQDTFVVLNSSPEKFSETLDNGKQSFLNALVCHRLYNQGVFIYLGGRMQEQIVGNESQWTHPMFKHHPSSKLIIRHGADRSTNLASCWPEWETAASMGRVGKDRKVAERFSQRLWPVGWWQQNTADDSARKIVTGKKTDRIEFCSPDIRTLCETYVSSLSGSIDQYQKRFGASAVGDAKYRVCMHRLISVLGKPYYQQITKYFGTNTDGEVGRVFEGNSGLAGLACALRKTVFAKFEHGTDIADSAFQARKSRCGNVCG